VEHGDVGVAVVTGIAAVPIPNEPTRSKGFLVDLIIAAVLTAVFIQWSLRYDWLAARPQFDDVSCFRWGLFRLVQLDHSFAALVTSLRTVPPHSPMADLLGMTAFAVFGLHDWAPAAANGLLLFAALRIVRHFTSSIPSLVRWAVVAVVVALPMVGQMVVTFRPDFFYGLLLAATIVHVLTRPVLGADWRRRTGLGVAAGALLLIKPSVYPQTVALIGFTVLLRSARDVFGPGPTVPVRTVLTGWLLVIAVAVLIAGPHYLNDSAHINHYIGEVVFGARSKLWHLDDLTFAQKLLYFLTGVGGSEMMGGEFYLLCFLLVMLGSAIFLTSGRGRRWDVTLLLVVLLATYLVPTINETKSRYLGLGFQWTLVLTVVWLADELFRTAPPRGRQQIGASIVCILAGLLSIYLMHGPTVHNPEPPAEFPARNTTADALWADVERYDSPGEAPPVVGLTTMGPMINPDYFGYMSLKTRLRHMDTGSDYPYNGGAAEVNTIADRSDIVIASEPGTGETDEKLQSSRSQAESLALIRSRGDLMQVADVPAYGGGHYFVFAKRGLLADKLPAFYGLTRADLSPPEGPYPQFGLPVTRIGLGAKTELEFVAPTPGRYALLTNGQSAAAGQTVTIKLNGREVQRVAVSERGFSRAMVWLDAAAGTNRVELDYAVSDTGPDHRPKAVLFQSIRIVEASKMIEP
jgi:hypothetical protein